MNYLVQMKLADSSRPNTQQEGIDFLEQNILPTLALCKKLEANGKILAGGPLSGAVALSLIVAAETAQELDQLITSLPVWPRMETSVTPLTSFDGRISEARNLLERVKSQTQNSDRTGA